MKKGISFLLTLVLLLTMFNVPVFATPGGSGTSGSPYLIYNWEDLNYIRTDASTLAANYKLMVDLTTGGIGYTSYAATEANGGKGWEPIGKEAPSFKGKFDGNNKTISGLVINRPTEDYIGLFGYLDSSASISGIGLTDVTITGRNYVGSLIGRNNGTLTMSYATGNVTGTDVVGGLVGQNEGTISKSYATGNVSGTSVVGGLVGRGKNIDICYATGNVIGTTEVGGLLGNVYGGTIKNTYAIGNVSGTSIVGGLIGRNGLAQTQGIVENSYSSGTVTGSTITGGLVGQNDASGEIRRSYWDTQTSGKVTGVGFNSANSSAIVGATGKTTAEMKTEATFTSWDFSTIWTIATKSYPYFKWMETASNWSTDLIPGYSPQDFAAGSGTTADDPYQITTKAELNNLRKYLGSSGSGVYFMLMNDITFVAADFASGGTFYNSGAGWEPIGTSTSGFTGSFDGNGKIISGLRINRGSADYIGLFGSVASGAAIKNVQLADVIVTGQSITGALAGENKGTISDSYVTGSVIGTGGSKIGGLVGYHVSGGALLRVGSGCTVSAFGTNTVMGGLVGTNEGNIRDAFAIGNLTGQGSAANHLGGFVGDQVDGSINNAYAAGQVNATTPSENYVGGFVGYLSAGIIDASFWDEITSLATKGIGTGSSIGLSGKITNKMKTIETFSSANWDFYSATSPSGIWKIVSSGTAISYPYFKWMESLVGWNVSKTPGYAFFATASGITVTSGALNPAEKGQLNLFISPAAAAGKAVYYRISSTTPSAKYVGDSIVTSDDWIENTNGAILFEISVADGKYIEAVEVFQSNNTITKWGKSGSTDDGYTDSGTGGGGTGGGGGGSATLPANGGVIVNGQQLATGNETTSMENGKSIVKLKLDNQAFGSILNAIKNSQNGKGNEIQLAINNTGAQVAAVDLSGDLLKNLEKNTVLISIKHNDVEYVIPAAEFNIGKVAETLGVPESQLLNIQVEVKISKVDAAAVEQYKKVAAKNNDEILVTPITFEIKARATKADGTAAEVAIDKFSNFVERITQIPAGVDPTKITTGIVFNADGTYSHVPTEVFVKDGRYYAKLNSLTNSNYSVIWNPITVASVVNHWSEKAVNDMASRMVVFNTDRFAPDQAITRADFAEYIVRALGLYQQSLGQGISFADVSSTGDRTKAIQIANQFGIITGYPDGTFRPDQLITREEAMAMYQRAMTVAKLTGSDSGRYQNYADYSQVEEWARGYVKEVLSAHVFNGTTATTISPKANLTYAESAQAIRNLLTESKLINQ